MINNKGFSMVDVIVLLSLILLLTIVIYPKTLDLLRKSNEAATRVNLTALRAAIAVYYGENKGVYPGADINDALIAEDGKYIKYIPECYCPPYHNPYAIITTSPTGDSGKWAYQVEDSDDRQAGELWIDCNEKDSKGVVWSSY